MLTPYFGRAHGPPAEGSSPAPGPLAGRKRRHDEPILGSEFGSRTAQQDKGQGVFELERDRILEVNLNGRLDEDRLMIAYLGNIRFSREGVLEHGLGNC